MSDLRDAVAALVTELDPDGAGFRTSEATGRLYSVAEEECGGELPPLTGALVRMGCPVAIKQHRPQPMSRAYEAAVMAHTGPQADMADLAEDFGWLDQHTALDEGEAAVRKRISHLDLAECLQVIALKRRKAAQAAAMADRLQAVVDGHPEWQGRPAASLGEIIGASAA